MNRLEEFREWYTELWARVGLYDSCLPDDLAFPDAPIRQFDAERMLRDASLSYGTDVEFGVFQILGADEARRAANIWSPITRLVTQEVSIAFKMVEEQREKG